MRKTSHQSTLMHLHFSAGDAPAGIGHMCLDDFIDFGGDFDQGAAWPGI